MEKGNLSVEKFLCLVEGNIDVYRFTDMRAVTAYARATEDSNLLAAIDMPRCDHVVLCVNRGNEQSMSRLLASLGITSIEQHPTEVCIRPPAPLAEDWTPKQD